jgi:hypothetical protein
MEADMASVKWWQQRTGSLADSERGGHKLRPGTDGGRTWQVNGKRYRRKEKKDQERA